MSNFEFESSNNKFNENDFDLDFWELFQSETDETRNLILDYLVKKCEIHNQNDYENLQPFDDFEDKTNEVLHFYNCNKYLNDSERRRKPFRNGRLSYSDKPCLNVQKKSSCINGDNCQFSHNQLEVKFHPMNFRKENCKSLDCDKTKKYCDKYHRTHDIRYFPNSKKLLSVQNNNNINNNGFCFNFNVTNPNAGKEIIEKYPNQNFINNECNNNSNNLINYNNEDKLYMNKENYEENFKKSEVEKEDILNKLNFDIKNLLDEFDIDKIDCDEAEIENYKIDIPYKKGYKENVIKDSKSASTTSKILDNSDNDLCKNNFFDKRSNSNSSLNNLRINLQNKPNFNMQHFKSSNKETVVQENQSNLNFNNNQDINNLNPMNQKDDKLIKNVGNDKKYANLFPSSTNLEKEIINQKFDLLTFKTIKCNINQKHNEKHCVFFHSNKDRRRALIKYSSDTCKYSTEDKVCPDGDFCSFSHNKVEMFYHPDRFKSKFCSQYSSENPNLKKNLINCAYGKYCSFAHSEEEIKIELIHQFKFDEDFFINHFKTVVCPFTHDHDKATCVYSHNWQDYRRNPKKYTYKNIPCQIWDIKKTILNYRDGCPKESCCMMCHGWKEEDFHPLNYKTKKCKNFNKICEKNIYCPFFHRLEEKRKIPLKIKQEYEVRLENKSNNQKYSNFMNDSFNMNRSNSVKSNLSDNISYNNQNRRTNFNINANLNNQNFNFSQNIQNQMDNNIINNKNVSENIKYMNNNFNMKNPTNYVHSPVFTYNNKINIDNFNNFYMMNNMNNNVFNYNNNNNVNKNFQFEGMNLNNSQTNFTGAGPKFNFNCNYNNPNINKNQQRLNNSNNMILKGNVNTNYWGLPNQFPFQTCFSSNNSVSKGSFSDNEINDNQFNNHSNKICYRSFSSHFSNSSSDLNESFKEDKNYGMIIGNPNDDSIDINEIENNMIPNKNSNSVRDIERKYGKNDHYCIETIEETNNFLKELIKEGENTLNFNDFDFDEKNFDDDENMNKNKFLEFLAYNKFNKLHRLIQEDKILLKDLIKFSDEKLFELIEPENISKSSKLIGILMKYDEKIEGDNVMECLNNLNFQLNTQH